MTDFKKLSFGDPIVMKRKSDERYANYGEFTMIRDDIIFGKFIIDIPRVLRFTLEGIRKSDDDYYIEVQS